MIYSFISFISNFVLLLPTDKVPSQKMLDATRDLIADAIENEYLSSNYTLYGHRQVRATDCPGSALYREIQNWPHYSSK